MKKFKLSLLFKAHRYLLRDFLPNIYSEAAHNCRAQYLEWPSIIYALTQVISCFFMNAKLTCNGHPGVERMVASGLLV